MKHIRFNTIQANKWVKGAAMLSLTVALQAKSCSSSGNVIDQQTTQKQTPLTVVEGMANLAVQVPGTKTKENALFYALGQNKQDVLDLVLERVSKNEINLRNPAASKEAFLQTVHPNGNPPLCQAIQLGKKEMAERLVETPGIDPTQANRAGKTPLMLAIEKQMNDLATKLIGRLSPSDLKTIDKKARTIMHIAARCNAQVAFEQLYNKLYKQEGDDVTQYLFQKDNNQYTVFASAYLPKNAQLGNTRLGKVLGNKDNDAMFNFILDCTKNSLSQADYTKIEREIDDLTKAKKIDEKRNLELRTRLNSQRNG